jgi:PTH1 family peptidyl-tRNA hydrolase
MNSIFNLFKEIEKSGPQNNGPVSFIVAGLGNPGKKYENTRHNAGFIAIDDIAKRLSVKIDRAKFHSLTAECEIGGVRVLLMKPETFMNNSGIAIGEASSFYKIPPERIIILHDEISFDAGVIRIRRKGSAGGHNGLKSVIAALSSENFPRVKIGVGQKPHPDYDLVDFVLGKIPDADLQLILQRLNDIYSTVELICKDKIDEAMNKYSKGSK